MSQVLCLCIKQDKLGYVVVKNNPWIYRPQTDNCLSSSCEVSAHQVRGWQNSLWLEHHRFVAERYRNHMLALKMSALTVKGHLCSHITEIKSHDSARVQWHKKYVPCVFTGKATNLFGRNMIYHNPTTITTTSTKTSLCTLMKNIRWIWKYERHNPSSSLWNCVVNVTQVSVRL